MKTSHVDYDIDGCKKLTLAVALQGLRDYESLKSSGCLDFVHIREIERDDSYELKGTKVKGMHISKAAGIKATKEFVESGAYKKFIALAGVEVNTEMLRKRIRLGEHLSSS